MGTTISFNGVTYTVPAEGDSGWATSLSNYFIALSTGTLQRSGGSFTLSAELNFGNAYGLKTAYVKSSATNPASAGILRLGNNESVAWRNAGNSADYLLKVNASNLLQFDSKSVLLSGDVVNADINASAAIAYSKLNLATSIVNADISGSAAIAYSKLNLATSIVNADISGSAAIAYSKLNLSTSILNADINASAAIAYSKLAALTASRVLVSDGSGFVSASSVTSTTLGYLDATSSVQTQLNAKAPSASPTLTTPSMDVVTLDGQGSTPASPSSGFYKLYVKDSTNKLTVLDSSGNETSVGSGGGGINLITNGDAESGTTGWATYADAAGTRPVDGTGGSPTVTWTTSSTTPLYGVNSFLFTKDAANRQGEGASYTFTVQPAHQAKVLNISFDYIVSSGTFVAGTRSTDSDIIAYIYDVTNSTLIEPSSIKLLSNSSSIADRFNASFQTSATGTSYRLILHCASTSASAYVVKFDNIQVSPSNYSYGTPITDWQSYTPTYTGFGSATGETYWRRVGANVEIKGRFTSGISTATEARMTLPSGFTSASTSIIPSITVAGLGVLNINSATTSTILIEPSVGYVTFGAQGASTQGLTKLNGSSFLSSGSVLTFTASIPCAGLSASVQMSDQTDTRVVDLIVEKTSTQSSITANTTKITYDTVIKDTHGMWSSDTATIRVAGDYIMTVGYKTATSSTTCLLYKNGSNFKTLGSPNSTYHLIFTRLLTDLKVGDTLDLRQGSTENSVGDSTGAYFISLSRVAGPNQIAASETISASYYCSTNQSATTSAPINFDSREHDSHSCVSVGASWKFTSVANRLYSVKVYGGPTTAVSGQFMIYKNGSVYKPIGQYTSGSNSAGCGDIRLNAGDYLEIRPTASHTFTGGSLSGTTTTNFSIVSVGL